MPIFMSTAAEAHVPSQILRYYADLVSGQATEELRESSGGGSTLVRRVPVGVIAAVAPWNFPNIMAALKYAPALAAGCTVVLKPSPETVLDAILLGEAALQAGMPPGVFNILFGGREAGARLVSHPGVDKVSFTGSTATGRQIGAVCGGLLRPVTLELGGKSAAIILDDADLDLQRIARQLATALFANNGQTCFLRLAFLLRASLRRGRRRHRRPRRIPHGGDPLDPATQVGPLVSRRQRDRVEGYIAKGLAEGARLVVGGGRPRPDTGWFVEPTVFADVDNSHTIAREEIFGPVVTITPTSDDDDAVRIANDSEYGLAATIWTESAERGVSVARRVNSGTVGINDYVTDLHSPTSMIKASGLGVKFGPESLLSYQRFQSIYL